MTDKAVQDQSSEGVRGTMLKLVWHINIQGHFYSLLWDSLPSDSRKKDAEKLPSSLLYLSEVHAERMSSTWSFCKQPVEKAGIRVRSSTGIYCQLLSLRPAVYCISWATSFKEDTGTVKQETPNWYPKKKRNCSQSNSTSGHPLTYLEHQRESERERRTEHILPFHKPSRWRKAPSKDTGTLHLCKTELWLAGAQTFVVHKIKIAINYRVLLLRCCSHGQGAPRSNRHLLVSSTLLINASFIIFLARKYSLLHKGKNYLC